MATKPRNFLTLASSRSSSVVIQPIVATDLPVFGGNGVPGVVPDPADSGVTLFLREDGKWAVPIPTGPGSGTVTSVDFSSDVSWLSVAGRPITATGVITLNLVSGQTANQFLATPNGTTGKIGLRSIAAADLPLFAGNGTSGIVPNPNDAGTTLFLREDGIWATPTGGGGGGSNLIQGEVPSGLINGSNVTFVLANTPSPATVAVFVNGLRLVSGEYTLSTATITLTRAPQSANSGNGMQADTIVCDYTF